MAAYFLNKLKQEKKRMTKLCNAQKTPMGNIMLFLCYYVIVNLFLLFFCLFSVLPAFLSLGFSLQHCKINCLLSDCSSIQQISEEQALLRHQKQNPW